MDQEGLLATQAVIVRLVATTTNGDMQAIAYDLPASFFWNWQQMPDVVLLF